MAILPEIRKKCFMDFKFKAGDYCHEIIFSLQNPERRIFRILSEIYTNTVLFEDGTTGLKSSIREINEWIEVEFHLPDKEVIAVGYQGEILVGYIGPDGKGGYSCESDHEVLENVTHWRPKPKPPIG